VEKIVLAGKELRPENVVAGHVHYLRYMPVSLLLRAEGEQWTLPATELPKDLPEEFDRVGCFQLRPTYDYLSTTWEDERLLVGPNIYIKKNRKAKTHRNKLGTQSVARILKNWMAM
jgi:hypothetical protein